MKLLRGCLGDQEKRISDLSRRLRRQEQEFTTIFEIVGQVSALAMNADALLKYLMRTVMGQFMVPRLLVLRREELEDGDLTAADFQGVSAEGLTVSSTGKLAEFALSSPRPFALTDEHVASDEEVEKLRSLGMVTCVPLIQQADRTHPAQIEGLLLLGERLVGGQMDAFERRMLGMLGQAVAITFHNELLYRRSIIDDLTGVSSRGHFEAHLSREIGRVRRYSSKSISLVMLDLDHFKNVNDTHGHLAGDEILKATAALLRDTVRSVDLVARYGGEEFAVILIEIDHESAEEVAERLRAGMERIAVDFGGRQLGITGSFGVACFPDDAEDRRGLLEAADTAVYRAKSEGRNRVCAAPPMPGREKPAGDGEESGG
ncbi:MAG: GGDEF domain-containing protein [Planctomycetota bacterium]|jgi:diguanylate cyclase (GGDEF)-like protein